MNDRVELKGEQQPNDFLSTGSLTCFPACGRCALGLFQILAAMGLACCQGPFAVNWPFGEDSSFNPVSHIDHKDGTPLCLGYTESHENKSMEKEILMVGDAKGYVSVFPLDANDWVDQESKPDGKPDSDGMKVRILQHLFFVSTTRPWTPLSRDFKRRWFEQGWLDHVQQLRG